MGVETNTDTGETDQGVTDIPGIGHGAHTHTEERGQTFMTCTHSDTYKQVRKTHTQ